MIKMYPQQYYNVGHLVIDENENELSANEATCKIVGDSASSPVVFRRSPARGTELSSIKITNSLTGRIRLHHRIC